MEIFFSQLLLTEEVNTHKWSLRRRLLSLTHRSVLGFFRPLYTLLTTYTRRIASQIQAVELGDDTFLYIHVEYVLFPPLGTCMCTYTLLSLTCPCRRRQADDDDDDGDMMMNIVSTSIYLITAQLEFHSIIMHFHLSLSHSLTPPPSLSARSDHDGREMSLINLPYKTYHLFSRELCVLLEYT